MYTYATVLTGGISSGKSTVASLFRLHGVSTIDADSIAHQKLQESASKIAELFGKAYLENGAVNRKKLGSLIFADASAKAKLESLLHPLIKAQILEEANQKEQLGVPYLIDIPLFFETKNYPFERSIVVYAPREIQLERLMNRDHLSLDEATARLEAQLPIETKKSLATYVIDNSTTLKNLQNEVERLLEILKKLE